MRKIMFSDKYQLTQAVLDGCKTQTRRIYKTPANVYGGLEVEGANIISFDANGNEIITRPKYKVGEVVAVAQRYSDFMEEDKVLYRTVKEVDGYRRELASEQKGWNNKLFICADLMPHRIRITNVRVERLNEISDSDCKAEGIDSWGCRGKRYYGFYDYTKDCFRRFDTPREAYAALIDKISGKGTWESNPYVFVYEFELIKTKEK